MSLHLLDLIEDYTDHAEECVACGRRIQPGERVHRTNSGPVCAEHNDDTILDHCDRTAYDASVCRACHGDGEIRLNHGSHLTEPCPLCGGW